MQADIYQWLLTLLNWLTALAGLQIVSLDRELVSDGWRQIPAGHCDFDPDLAEHFKRAGMRNGKHINMAVNYAVIAKWNRSNKKRRDDARTYGTDSYYAKHYADVDRKTWARHMDELAALGLVIISSVQGKPAYEAVGYQFVNDGLILGENSHAHEGGHGDHQHGHDGQGGGHDDHHQYKESKHSSESAFNELSSSADARDVDDDHPAAFPSKNVDEPKAQIPKDESAQADLMTPMGTTDGAVHTLSPSSAEPPSPVDDLKAFFTGCDESEVRTWVEQHGVENIYRLIKAAVGNHKITTPVGFVRWQLESGRGGAWKVPRHAEKKDDWNDKFANSAYADFIKS